MFNAQRLTSSLFWASPTGDLPFDKFTDVDACLYSTCPTVSGTQQQLSYSLRLDKFIPNGIYTLKWRLWDAEDESKECCFKTNVKIR
uniref:MD-2-related lipid-recognition protein n=2 Tax=Pararge aegeria TaxID=116150 RepID=S4PRA9_9NEOP